MQKKAVKVVLTDQVWAKRRVCAPLAAAVLLVVAVAATAACLLVYRDSTADSDTRSDESAGDVLVFRLNASESGLPERIVLRPREWTTEFHTETMDVLHHFRKNVTLLHVKDDVQTPVPRPLGAAPSTAAAAAAGSLCFVAPADPADLRPNEMMRMLEEGQPLPKPEKVSYYDLAALTDENLKDIAIDDQMVGFCGNSSVFTLKHIFDEEPREEPTGVGRTRSGRAVGDMADPFRLSVRPDGFADLNTGLASHLPLCSAATSVTDRPSVTPCCQAKAFSCPPKIRYHCYLKLMNGVCDKPSCSGPQCSCPVKSMLVCVRLRGGPWSKKMCCARGQEPCDHRCFPELADGGPSALTTTASAAAALSGVSPGRLVSLLPPEISVRVYPPPLPRVTLGELRARRLFVLHRILP